MSSIYRRSNYPGIGIRPETETYGLRRAQPVRPPGRISAVGGLYPNVTTGQPRQPWSGGAYNLPSKLAANLNNDWIAYVKHVTAVTGRPYQNILMNPATSQNYAEHLRQTDPEAYARYVHRKTVIEPRRKALKAQRAEEYNDNRQGYLDDLAFIRERKAQRPRRVR